MRHGPHQPSGASPAQVPARADGFVVRYQRFLDLLITRIAGSLAAWTLGAAAITIGMQIVSRYVFNHSFVWAEELARYFGIYSAMFGAGYGYREGQHIGVSLVVQKLRGRLQRAVYVAAHLICIWFFGVALWHGIGLALRTAERGQATAALEIPMWWMYLAIPIGSLLIILTAVEGILTGRAPCLAVTDEAHTTKTEGQHA